MIPQVFRDIDIIASLGCIMNTHTTAYKEDFELDKKLIYKMAQSPNPEDRRLIWFCRPFGTHCLRERDVFLENSYENKTFRFYHEQTKDNVLAYAVHLKEFDGAIVKGDIFTLDYEKEVEKLSLLTCDIKGVTIVFEDEKQFTVPYSDYRGVINELTSKHGRLVSIRYEPESEIELAHILNRQRFKRDRQANLGDFEKHIEDLTNCSVKSRLQKAKAEVQAPAQKTAKKDEQLL